MQFTTKKLATPLIFGFNEVTTRPKFLKGSDKLYLQFITYLLTFIKYQERVIVLLMSIILGKSVARGLYDEPINKPYRKLEVDEMHIIVTLEKLVYIVLFKA